MIRIIRKTSKPVEVFVTSREFEELLSKKDFKIVALKNNALSQKYFEDDSRFLIFNTQYGMEKGYFTNNLTKENIVDEIVIIK